MQQARLLHLLARRLGSDGARAQLIETDISWILLTGDLAYKFKKAIRRDVLAYGSLTARRVACEEELRLNRALRRYCIWAWRASVAVARVPSSTGRGRYWRWPGAYAASRSGHCGRRGSTPASLE